ncbi:hypothetical protein [Jeotgalicoccus sp. WY2]|uniref:hypothetical protein n=1 Tax=Jeotgalicoccus sp. WY2 TaxID=2708346 RepID=UPI001BD602E5|nr:hypothetical protein [Jeotgalicoccus sp. WY2]
MKNKWQAAFEVAKYTNYDFLHYENDTEIIWLKDRKKKTLMCLLDLDLSDSELESLQIIFLIHRIICHKSQAS